MQITRQMKREAALREVGMRRRVYPRWVRESRMTSAEAAREITIMEAIAADYAEADLFGEVPG